MKITLRSILSYLVGLILVGFGFLSAIQTLYGLAPLIAGLLVLPPVRRWFDRRAGIEFGSGVTAAIGVVGILALLVALLAVGATTDTGAPGSDVSNVSVSATDETLDQHDASLHVNWNARAQSAVDPDSGDISTYQANDGEKYLVVRMQIENTGDSEVELTPRAFQLESDGVVYSPQTLFGSGNSLSDVTLTPGGSYSAWVAFSVPEGASTGTVSVDQEAYYDRAVAVSFTHDTGMPINMSA